MFVCASQWLDCLDTVSQWLESTVLKVIPRSSIPSDPASEEEPYDPTLGTVSRPLSGSSPLSSVSRLFPPTSSDLPSGPPHTVLLVRYNGWPQRWDEYIPSNSPRLSPFRTRTRHYAHGCPIPNAHVAVPESEVPESVTMKDVYEAVEKVKSVAWSRRAAAMERLGRVMVDAARIGEAAGRNFKAVSLLRQYL